jgi:hypothetical protein
MENLRKGAAALIAAAALSIGGVTLASAATAPNAQAPCATQQTHVDKAQAKLDWLTKRFEAQAAKVKKDRRAVAATKGSAKAQAKKALAADKAKKVRIAKAKKAQVQRLEHAKAALAKCQAAHPTTAPTTGA